MGANCVDEIIETTNSEGAEQFQKGTAGPSDTRLCILLVEVLLVCGFYLLLARMHWNRRLRAYRSGAMELLAGVRRHLSSARTPGAASNGQFQSGGPDGLLTVYAGSLHRT